MQIIRRKPKTTAPTKTPEHGSKGYPAKRKGSKSRVVVKAPKTPDDIVQWEPCPGFNCEPAAVFAAEVASWIESFVHIRPKRGPVVQLRLNRIQLILMQFVAWRWVNDLPAKVITPKARQLGSSTFWEAMLYAMAELVPGYQSMIVAQDDKGLTQLWGKVETIKHNMHKTSWGDSKLVNDQGGLLKWNTEAAIFSGLIKTGDALGRGGTPTAVHFSEVASFSDMGKDPEPAIAAILACLAESTYSLEIYESTAKGKDKTFFGRCEAARDIHGASELTLIFLPWYLDPDYSMSWARYRRGLLGAGKEDPGETFEASEEERGLREKVATLRPTASQKAWQHPAELSDDQLIWRRWYLANKCKNDINIFRREFPSFYEECFTASMESGFAEATIEHYRKSSKEPFFRGFIVPVDSGRKRGISDDPLGPVRIWELPQKNAHYILGADVGGSLVRSDPHCAYVMDKFNCKIVASIHGHMEWDAYAKCLYDLATYYNNAYAVIENNYQPAVANYLHQRNYPNLYYYYVQSQVDALQGRNPGFSTNKKTRSEWVARVRTFCRTLVLVNPDPDFPAEMETFIWVPNTTSKDPDMEGTFRAVGGNNDDRIVAAALCLTQIDRQAEEEPLPEPEQDPEDPEQKPCLVYEMFRDRLVNKKDPKVFVV